MENSKESSITIQQEIKKDTNISFFDQLIEWEERYGVALGISSKNE